MILEIYVMCKHLLISESAQALMEPPKAMPWCEEGLTLFISYFYSLSTA